MHFYLEKNIDGLKNIHFSPKFILLNLSRPNKQSYQACPKSYTRHTVYFMPFGYFCGKHSDL